eukprot:PhF_6_TR19482/c0_g1_i1/m.28465/K17609/NXN; nucleoredoxin
MQVLQEFGITELQGKEGSVPVASLSGKYVMLYFSAHWCPPCRGFTPKLAEFYNKHRTSKNVEVIFISSDQDQPAFDGYFHEHPWLALPYAKRTEKNSISAKFSVSGIPTLILFGPDGAVITGGARGNVMQDPEATGFPWTPVPPPAVGTRITTPKHAHELVATDLTSLPAYGPRGTFGCDGCGGGGEGISYHCAECNYDLCAKCGKQ